MKLSVEPGTYVVAVSGGVDSMVLLDMLRQHEGLKLIVAHFDHGIRSDSVEDRKLVQRIAMQHGLPFVYHEGKLGEGTSEAAARQARYKFLAQVKQGSNARAVLMAHHQDDALETAIINLIRGTNRRGLTSLKDHEVLQRPLLHMTKRQLRAYAQAHRLDWREDRTNKDTTYLRNHIRHNVVSRLSIAQRQQLTQLIHQAHDINHRLEVQLINYLHMQPMRGVLDRGMFIGLPHKVSREVLATWLRQHGINQFDKKALERLVVGAKTGKKGSRIEIVNGWQMRVLHDQLALHHKER